MFRRPLKVGKVSAESCSAALDALEDAIAQELLEQGTNKNWIQSKVNRKVTPPPPRELTKKTSKMRVSLKRNLLFQSIFRWTMLIFGGVIGLVYIYKYTVGLFTTSEVLIKSYGKIDHQPVLQSAHSIKALLKMMNDGVNQWLAVAVGLAWIEIVSWHIPSLQWADSRVWKHQPIWWIAYLFQLWYCVWWHPRGVHEIAGCAMSNVYCIQTPTQILRMFIHSFIIAIIWCVSKCVTPKKSFATKFTDSLVMVLLLTH